MPNIFINQPLYYAEELKLLCAYKFNMKWIGSPLVDLLVDFIAHTT